MVEVRLQERVSRQGKKEYKTYVVTLPKVIIEAIPNLAKTKRFNVKVESGKIILVPKE